MDKKILHKLEFNKIQNQLAEFTSFAGGYKKVKEMKPSSEYGVVIRMLNETEEAIEALRFGSPTFLSGLKPIESQLAKARVNGMLNPPELYDIYCILNSSRMVKKYINSDKYPVLYNLTDNIYEDILLEKKLDEAVSEEGKLKDNASPVLKSIRSKIKSIRLKIREYLQSFIKSSNNQRILQDTLITERDGRYVVPVKHEYKNEVKGIVHDESASGATVFIEPLPVVEQNNRIRSLQREQKREEERILRDLSLRVAAFADELSINADILSELDWIFARAKMALKTNSFRPQINTSGIIDINRGKHPLLGEDAVPLNVKVGKKFDILVITGPNTGGKTVALKTIGLLTLMAMSGLFIPARENSCISVFKKVYVDVGDEQSIEQSLSTFSSHMTNIIDIIRWVDDQSLVLLDELGAGTDPVEGAVLARVILEELHNKKVKVVVTTHHSELKNFAYQNDRVENACVEFDPVNLKPTYELTIGMPGQSNAFEIASRLGLQPSLVKRAKELVPQKDMEISKMIRQLKESHHNLEVSSREVENLKTEVLKEKDTLKEEKESLIIERDEILDKARKEAAIYVKSIKKEADEAIMDLKTLLKKKEQPPKWHELEQSRQKLKKLNLNKLPETRNGIESKQDINPGDYVQIKDINQNGYVLEGPNSQGEVIIQVGILKLTVKKEQLNLVDSPEEKNIYLRNKTYFEKARNISKEIDVRGKLADDAILEIDKYLDDANLVGLDSVRIIHGKGTGALRTAVRNYLQNHRYIKSFRDGLREEGGFGVTIAELK
jgi:DNA mismatch repair protein MutS2